MYAQKKIGQLIEDENFQDDIFKIESASAEEQMAFLKKYSITEKEFAYARKFLLNFSFTQKEVSDSEIDYALGKLRNRIFGLSSPSSNGQGKARLLTLFTRVAAILSIPLLLSTIYFYREFHKQKQQYSVSTPNVYNTFKAPLGARTQVVLPDGSLVWLNSGSSLTYPSCFDTESRKISLEGEAYFEVVKNENVPMEVSAGQLKVRVYGTKFNLNAYADEDRIETTLVEGKVALIPKNNKKEIPLEPGYNASFSLTDQHMEISKVKDMEAYIGWKDGKLLFRDEQLIHIVKDLERRYNVDIQVTDTSLYEYTLYATFIDENIEQVLDIFSNSIPISIEYPKSNMQSNGQYSKRKIIIRKDHHKKMKVE
ncbi:MAG: FecR family protein [Prolixibacteraceae bacterium]|nr:FecR family protein [Prolixibacteraceae bacterium]